MSVHRDLDVNGPMESSLGFLTDLVANRGKSEARAPPSCAISREKERTISADQVIVLMMTTTHPVAAEDDLSPLCSPSFFRDINWQILLSPADGSRRRRHGRRGGLWIASPRLCLPLVYAYTHTDGLAQQTYKSRRRRRSVCFSVMSYPPPIAPAPKPLGRPVITRCASTTSALPLLAVLYRLLFKLYLSVDSSTPSSTNPPEKKERKKEKKKN